jgi:hypothetical protein
MVPRGVNRKPMNTVVLEGTLRTSIKGGFLGTETTFN